MDMILFYFILPGTPLDQALKMTSFCHNLETPSISVHCPCQYFSHNIWHLLIKSNPWKNQESGSTSQPTLSTSPPTSFVH
jgi:hypothetical protein